MNRIDGAPQARTALVVDDSTAVQWHDEFDVVVVGFGCAGAVAALRALELGRRVAVLDRFAGGGSTAYSGGVLYAGGTRYQKDAGFDDTPEEMFKYLQAEIKGVVGEETLRRFCEQSAGYLDWLGQYGVEFSGEAYLEKTTYPPEGKFLYFTGNERADPYDSIAKPAPRGHRTVGVGFTGKDLFDKLSNAVVARGGTVIAHAPARRLVVDSQRGRIMGVEADVVSPSERRRHTELYAAVEPFKPFNTARADRAIAEAQLLESRASTRRLLRAREGVILASGGYIYNAAMMRRHQPDMANSHHAFLRVGSMGEDGSGIELGQSVGGATTLMDNYLLAGPTFPPKSLLQGIMVNRAGDRFINESAYSGFLGEAALQQPGGVVWLVIDARTMRATLREIAFPKKGMFRYYMLPALLNIAFGGTRRAGSVPALARRCGIDAEGLSRTLDVYNRAALSSQSDAFKKSRDYVKPLTGALYALNLSPFNRFTFRHAMTLGGLTVDEATGAVQRADRSAIPGLYAAGRSAVGICSRTYLSGMALSDAVFSGLRAAESLSPS